MTNSSSNLYQTAVAHSCYCRPIMTVFEQLLLPSSYPPSLLHTWQHTLNNTIVCISDTIQSTPRLLTMYHKSRNSHQRRRDDGDPSLLVATFPCIFPPRLTSPPSPFTPQFPEELELTQCYLWVLLFNTSFSKICFFNNHQYNFPPKISVQT